jgi:hypothetical protein
LNRPGFAQEGRQVLGVSRRGSDILVSAH